MAMMRNEDGCVLTCTVTDCSYNQSLECCAPQIQVGDDHPTCDTYTTQPNVQLIDHESIVGTCKVMECTFNDSQMCHARGITVNTHAQHADCATFRP